ncbi:50S ribosomal protein acetyltransferase [hydrothermal vent metagenome]|uniref:50S ribosomal protein acetyltransferase n=1 Tax=hydrothermal vent metagenome TaxID=652676 RepID=A0A3B0QZ70_9ZZZZ
MDKNIKMNVATKRLLLRELAMNDAPRITELFANPKVISMLEQPPWPYQLQDAQFWLRGTLQRQKSSAAFSFAIELPNAGLIGSIGIQKKGSDLFDLGYWLGQPYWGNGYISEAASAFMTWAQEELGVRELLSGYFADNPASGRVLAKLGFVATGKSCIIENPLRDEPIACLGMNWKKENAATLTQS